MARSSSSIFFLFSLVAILISTSCQAKSSDLLKNNVAGLFIFGDSFLDAGNNNYINTTTLDQANFWPYGETYFKFPTGRFSDGRLVSDFIGEILEIFLYVCIFYWLCCTNLLLVNQTNILSAN